MNRLLIIIGMLLIIYLYTSNANIENFTPEQVDKIINQPGATPIGTTKVQKDGNRDYVSISNGYNSNTMNNLQGESPEPHDSYDNSLGNFPIQNEILPTTKFEFPNKHNFTINYPCRKSATGMFTDCSVWSANLAWTADPYKGLSCKLNNDRINTPKQNNNFIKDDTNKRIQQLQFEIKNGMVTD